MPYLQDEYYEYFVCYYERSARDFAQQIYDVLTKDFGYKVYVDHIYRNQMSGKFRQNIDDIINRCKVFILLNTIGSLSRPEVIREVKTAFPNGELDNHEFWIFREKSDDVPKGMDEFLEQTRIDLFQFTQPPFSNVSELARIIIRMCKSRENYILSLPRTHVPQGSLSAVRAKKSKTSELNIDQLREEASKEYYNKNYLKALDVYNQILDNNPSDISAINAKGIVLIGLKKFSEAMFEFSSAIYLNSQVPELWSNKAMVLYLQGSNEEALRDIDKSISIVSKHEHSKLRDFFYIKAIILFGLRKYEQSKEWFDKTTAIDSRFSLALSGNAAALARMGYKEKSIKLLHDAIEIDSHNYNAWYNLGVMYEIDAKYHQALLHYNRSIEINQHNYASFTNRGRILRILSRNEEALESYDNAIRESPEGREPYFNKGTCLGLMGRFEESLIYFDKSLEINPNSINTLINKAESLYHLKRYEEAMNNARVVLKYDKKNLNALKIMAYIIFEDSRYPEAEEKFREIYCLDAKDLNIIYALLETLMTQQKYSEALPICNEAIKNYP